MRKFLGEEAGVLWVVLFLENFHHAYSEKIYAPIYAPCLNHCAVICKLPGFGSTYTL